MTRILFALIAAVTLMAQTAPPSDIYIKAGRLIDGRNPPRSNVVIRVRGADIAEVGSSVPIPAGATVIDLSRETVLPGLIDAHTHIALHAGDSDAQTLRETPEYRAIYASANAAKTLAGGVTTIRDLGNEGSGFADIALREAIEKGIVPGPRIVAAIRPVTATGAYGLVGYSPYVTLPPLSQSADGPTEVRKAIRTLIFQGADVIKVYMESFEKRELRKDILTGSMNYSREELAAIVEEAHRAHVKVAAHTYSDEAARLAIDVGVDSIEHGLYLTEPTFQLMAKRGIYYVPTLLVYELWRDNKIFAPVPASRREQIGNTVREHVATFRRALRTPVKIVFGSDTFELPGTNAEELELLVRYGMTPEQALRAGTTTAAELLGLEKEIGSIEPGKSADIIAVHGDPMQDIRSLRNIAFVMRAGKVFTRAP
ncbi:MAG TPA: amidohydrolase family protein [Sphingomicrobium sp.]|jgi:imidazolonepropionase-like amidohydrolase